MHRYHVLALLFFLLSLTANAAVGRDFAQKRDVSTTTSIQEAQTTTQAASSITSLPATSSATDLPSSTTSVVATINSDISNPQPTLESSPRPTTNGTLDVNGLPIQPIITPAIGVAGVALIITGLAYSLVGIKNQWLHVFLSAAFLTSLSVTVLIEYVMSPPVSNAVQGAYFVAAFFTGIIFGALSLIFKELTEGLGCLLGGFCLSMWLLSLKQGGLLASSETRGAFIGAFSIAFYALSFSSYTRPYGLIVSTAFAGSTVAVLGIDCFSRAGWKEFWLYIWGLNDNLFPFGTSTYPVTRGIRVELAVAVVVCLLGLLSQFRLWKLIRERRKKQEEALAEEKRKKDEAEMELGRAIEEKKENDLVRWEAMYGGSSKGESTAVQSPVSETNQGQWTAKELSEAPDNSVEMADLSASAHETVTDNEAVEKEHQHEDGVGDVEKDTVTGEQSPEESPNKTDDCAAECGADEMPVTTNYDSKQTEEIDSGSSLQPPPPPPPCVTPLPFRVPYSENEPVNGDDDDDSHSIQAIVDDVDSASVRTSKRLSAASLFRRLSHRNNANRRSRLMQSESDERLVPTSPVSDTSSNHGIVDSEAGSILERSQSIEMDIHLHTAEQTPNEDHKESLPEDVRPDETPSGTSSACTDETKHVEDIVPQADSSQIKPEDAPPIEDKTPTEIDQLEGDSGIVSERRRHTIDGITSVSPIKAPSLAPVSSPPSKTPDTTSEKEGKVEKLAAPLSSAKSKPSAVEKENLTSDVVRKLPSHVSPVVMSYRTNEWAKHLSHADAPELEPLAEPEADTEQAISPEDVEIAAPLNIEELKQTPLTAAPPPATEKRTSHSENVSNAIIQRSTSNISKQSAGDFDLRQSTGDQSLENITTPPLKPASEVAASTSPHLLHASSRSPPPPTSPVHGSLRSVSSPLLSTTLAAPPTQKTEVRHSVGQVIQEEPYSLMAQREKMIQARLSSMSLTRDSWAPRNKSRQSMTEEVYNQSRPGSQLSLVEDDDMPLTQRRALLQQKATSPPLLGMDPEIRRSPIDRHPRLSREISKPKVTTMAAWRESLQEDFTKPSPLHEVDLAQNELMEQQRKAQVARSQRILASENLHNSIAERMRHGDMQDLHREAMRRMQATANRKAMNKSP